MILQLIRYHRRHSIVWETNHLRTPVGLCKWSPELFMDWQDQMAPFLATTAGQFRVNYKLCRSCFNRNYFNVYQNVLNQPDKRDIVCNSLLKKSRLMFQHQDTNGNNKPLSVFKYFNITNSKHLYCLCETSWYSNQSLRFHSKKDVLDKSQNFYIDGKCILFCFGDKGNIPCSRKMTVEPQYTFNIYAIKVQTPINTSGLSSWGNQFLLFNLKFRYIWCRGNYLRWLF
jgi:hypothetical protein